MGHGQGGILAQLWKFSWLTNIIWGGTGILTCVLGALYIYQESLLYHPAIPGVPKAPKDNPPGYRSPEDVNIKDFEEHFIKTKDGAVVHAWLMLQPQPRLAPTIVYFHGNAGNMGFRLPHGYNIYQRVKANVMLVDYRGYGESEGRPSEPGLVMDGEAVLETLKAHDKIDSGKIILYGKSLGGAVSLALTERYPDDVMAVVLENTFLSIPAMVDVLMPYVRFFKNLILRIGWHNDERIQKVRQPVLFISGLADELVPPAHMSQLYKLARRSKHRELFTVATGTHNDTMIKGGYMYFARFRDFVQKVLAMKGEAASSSNGGGGGAASCQGGDVGDSAPTIQEVEGAIPIMPDLVGGAVRSRR